MLEEMGDKGMAEGGDAITCHTFTKERHPQAMSDYHTLSVICNPSKITLRVILGQLEAKADELLAEGQAGVTPGRHTVEHIFNSPVIIQKRLQQHDLFHNFIDFKKAFDRIQHAGLWQVRRSFNLEEGLVQATRAYENSNIQSSLTVR